MTPLTHARFKRSLISFRFREEPAADADEPNNQQNAGDGQPKDPTPELEAKISALRASDPKLFDVIFGRGVKKAAAGALTKEQVAAAKKLFAAVKPEDVDKLLTAQQQADEAKLEAARKTTDFTTFAKELEEKFKREKKNDSDAYSSQIKILREDLSKREASEKSLIGKLTNVLVINGIQAIAAAKGVIDPSDVILHLADKVVLNDKFEPEIRPEFQSEGATIEALVDGLLAKKPHLVKATQRKGNGEPATRITSKATETGSKRTFKRSELRDPKFYSENEADILKAMQEGRITNDVS